MTQTPSLFAVVLAGGSGTRFWPVSRELKPKQFLRITGSEPLLVETCNRLNGLVEDRHIAVILGDRHIREAERCLAGRGVHLLGEPVGRNTAPCIGLGALYARHLGATGAVAFLPADHYIADPQTFLAALSKAAAAALSGGIVTLGILPTHPETGYGYIRRQIPGGGEGVFPVARFVEKPDLEHARQYLASGDYYWNAGIFVATADTILREIERHLPELHQGLARVARAFGTAAFKERIAEAYEAIAPVSFDYGIMEKTGVQSFVVPCECGWSDVGSWASLHQLRQSACDESGNLSEGENLLVDCRNSFVSSSAGRTVACLGLEEILVVDTPDALLVTRLPLSQEIRKVVDRLRAEGKESVL